MATEPEDLLKCPFCEKTFASRQGLWGHLKTCEAKPDEDDDDEPSRKSSSGFLSLFDDDDENDEEKDEYECPGCGYTSDRQFSRCKECGCDVEW